jgi:predicted deacetylase
MTMNRPALVVSLHDVSPLTRDAFAAMIDELRALGVTKCSLLVVADHHHKGHFLADPGFCRWLEGLAAAGHELVIHGYYHQRPRREGETFRQRMTTRLYTADEGEFYDLPKTEAAALLERAKADFRQLDAPTPCGFIAPAWLLGDEAAEAVREAGFRYTTRLGGVEDYAKERRTASQSLVYSCRNAWRRAVSLGWNASLAWRLRHAPLLRLGLHPPDYRHAPIWGQIRRLAGEAARSRQVATYAEFVTG